MTGTPITSSVAVMPAAMIVACEYPPFPGGIGTYSGELAATLAAAGVGVSVIAPFYPELSGPLPEGVDHNLLLGHHRIKLKALPFALAALRRVPKSTPILAADVRTVLLVWALRPLHRRAYRVMVHGSEASKFDRGGVMFALARRAYHGAEIVAYNSLATRDIFRERLGKPPVEAVTYLGVDRQWFEDAPSGGFKNVELAALPQDVPVFCSVGRLEERKGQVEAIHALARAAAIAPHLRNAVYVVVGRTEDEDYARRIVQEAQRLSVRIIVTGRLPVDDIKRLYRRSVAHLLFAVALPGKIEGFGLVLIEAAAQACPSIVTRVGGIPEVLGDAGAVADAGDVEGFASHIVAMATDRALRDAAGKLARDDASRFTWTACARATFPEFAAIIADHEPAADRTRQRSCAHLPESVIEMVPDA